MMSRQKVLRLTALLLAVLLTAGMSSSAFAEAGGYDFSRGLEGAVTDYMSSHGLNENNFSMGFYNTVTGESWFYNPDTFFAAGSMYKLPLVMLYEDMLAEGTRSPGDYVGGYTILQAMQLAIVNSDNTAAGALEDGLRMPWREYRQKAAAYSGIDMATLPESYYNDNTLSPRIMIGTLQYLYAHSDRYNDLIYWMTQAEPGHYFRLNPSPYLIAQKYGAFNIPHHIMATCGIIYAPQPYLLVVFINGAYLESVIADMATLTSAYVDSDAHPVVFRDINVAGGIRLRMNGKEFRPKNALGEEVDVFTCDGTTYLPVRALAEALGCEIEWDGDTRTVYISSP